jgi:hypothetical protein
MATPNDARICLLDQATGADGACPEEHCPFWEPGGAVLEGRCVFAGIDFARDPGSAEWLRRIRERVESPAPPVDV